MSQVLDVTANKGLADVAVDSTSISQVQGDKGRLIYRGISIEDLAEKSTFEETAYLVLNGKLPNSSELSAFIEELKKRRTLPPFAEATVDAAPRDAHPMAVLQSAVASLSYSYKTTGITDQKATYEQALDLISKVPTLVARISRRRRGLAPVAADNSLSHTDNFYYMLNGSKLSGKDSRYFEVAMMLHIDHDFNASTFASRVVASTEASLPAAISSGVGSLSGPLHGGANEKVIAMAEKIGSPDKAAAFIADALATKKKVMGFGHRVYRTLDPRAKVLRKMLEEKVGQTGDRKIFDTLLIVHDTMIGELSKKEKDYIWPNVDFWSGALYLQLKLESIDFTPLFAMARVVGWTSHVLELWKDNRIFRPAAKYVGQDNVPYTGNAR